MIEAFKQTKIITSKKLNLKSNFLMCMNIFFPFVDLALLFFIPLGLIFLLFHNNLFMGFLTLLVILLGMILCLVIEIKRQNVFREIDCKLEKRSILAFIFLCTILCLYSRTILPNWIYKRNSKYKKRMVIT